MKVKNILSGNDATVLNAKTIHFHTPLKSRPKMAYPPGSIGSDLVKRNYVKYLVERYNRFKQADESFGKAAVRRFSYAIIFKNVEARFKAPTYFIPIQRFAELVDYLHDRIDQTILGKRNRAQGQKNYESFDEYQLTQADEGETVSAG